MSRPGWAVLVALAIVLVAGTALRVSATLDPNGYSSPDELNYTILGTTIATGGSYAAALNTGYGEAYHWPPGTPLLFAASHELTGDLGPNPAYWAQTVVGVLLIVICMLLAARLAGWWAAVAAGGAVALYPPLIRQSGDLLSEPLGALALAAAALGVLWAWERRSVWWFAVPGAALAVLVLTRTDHLLLPAFATLLVGVALWRRDGLARGAAGAAVMAAATLVLVLPWVLHASAALEKPVPITTGGGSALFVGTYLPGDGRTGGLKRALADEARALNPKFRDTPTSELPAGAALAVIAARHPDLSREEAVQREGRRNLVRYGLGQPIDFTSMMVAKSWRMWTNPFSGGGYANTGLDRLWHRILLAFGAAGLVLALWRTRHPALLFCLLALVLGSGIHAIVVSQPRYNLPLMPLLLTAGAIGWARALGARPAGRVRS
ncbi:MAG: glycosyltransferase family 39 protein [Solirubrobacterales bacterium]